MTATREDVREVIPVPSHSRYAVARRWTPWLSLASRVVLAAVLAYAAVTKIADPAATVRAVRAYELLPEGVAVPFAHALPTVELVLAVLLVLGAGLRFAGAASTLLMTMFVLGIASAWARGLKIDCGCFGGGGVTADPHYVRELLRDGVLLGLAVAVLVIRTSRWAFDPDPAEAAAAAPVHAGGGRNEQRRQKAARLRAAAAEREARQRWWWYQGAAAVTVVVAAVVAIAVTPDPASAASSPRGVTSVGGIVVGDTNAPHRLVVFEDPQCPVCARFEQQMGDLVTQAVARGTVSVEYRMRSFIGVESVRAVAALGVAQDLGKFAELRAALFANQPRENSGGYAADDLIRLGAQVGLTDRAYADAIRKHTYAKWAEAVDNQASRDHNVATPELRLDGKVIDNMTAFDRSAFAAVLGLR